MYSDDLLNGMTVLTAEEYVLGGDVPIKYGGYYEMPQKACER